MGIRKESFLITCIKPVKQRCWKRGGGGGPGGGGGGGGGQLTHRLFSRVYSM